MAENSKKQRDSFLTFILWASILQNAFIMALIIINRDINEFYGIVPAILFLYIAAVKGIVLLLNWKILGFYIIALISIVFPLVRIFVRYSTLANICKLTIQ
jgi:hypothetical protein